MSNIRVINATWLQVIHKGVSYVTLCMGISKICLRIKKLWSLFEFFGKSMFFFQSHFLGQNHQNWKLIPSNIVCDYEQNLMTNKKVNNKVLFRNTTFNVKVI